MARNDASNGARPGKAKGDATRAKSNSARRPGGRHAGPVYAAVDLGTNNCRLLIARPNAKDRQQSFTVVDAFRASSGWAKVWDSTVRCPKKPWSGLLLR